MDKTILTRLRVNTIIGVLDWERKTPQDVLVTVTAFREERKPGTPDDLAACLDYSLLARDISDLVTSVQRFTVEALAEDVANLCLGRSGVRKVIVLIEKPGAVAQAETVGVEIERSNPNSQ